MPPSSAVPHTKGITKDEPPPTCLISLTPGLLPFLLPYSFHLQTVICLSHHTVIAENSSEAQWQSPHLMPAVTHSSWSEKVLHTFVWFSPWHHFAVGAGGSTSSAWLQISVFWFVFYPHRPILCPLQSHARCHLLPASRKYLLPPTEPCLQMVARQLRLSPSAAFSSRSFSLPWPISVEKY